MNKPIIIPSPENLNVYVLAQPGTRSPETNMKSTSRSVIQSSLAFATVLASYPLLYILTPILYIIHFMVSGGLIKSNNQPTSWDATSYCPSTIQAPFSSTSKNLPQVWSSRPLGLLVPPNLRPHQAVSRRLTWKTTSRFTFLNRRVSS